MATSTRSATSSPEDESLEQAIEQTRARVKALEEKLSSRRAAEAAELELLQSQLAELERRATQAKAATEAARAHHAALVAREESLQRGLDLAQRSWSRVIEPALGSVALFFCILIVGFANQNQGRTFGLELLGVATGAVVGLAWRQRRRHR